MKCTDITSSQLKAVVTIQIPTRTIDEYGMEKVTWTEHTPIRGLVRNSSFKKNEFLQANGVASLDCKDLIIRYKKLDMDCRVIYKANQYKVVAMENLEENDKYLVLTLERFRNG